MDLKFTLINPKGNESLTYLMAYFDEKELDKAIKLSPYSELVIQPVKEISIDEIVRLINDSQFFQWKENGWNQGPNVYNFGTYLPQST